MKFAVLVALLGLAGAQEIFDEEVDFDDEIMDDDVEEDLKVGLAWKHSPETRRQISEIAETWNSKEARMNRAKAMKKMQEIGAFWEKAGPKYLPELKAWGQSPAVRGKKAHEAKIMKSKLYRDLMDDVMEVGKDLKTMKAGKKMTKAGVLEWVDNKDLMDLIMD